MTVLRHALVCVSIAISASIARGQMQVTFADQDFEDADWTTTILVDRGGSSTTITANQRLRGGNPGSYRQIIHEGEPDDGEQEILVAHLKWEAIYDPRTSGALTDIGYEYHLRNLEPEESEFTVYYFVVMQDGSFFGTREPTERATDQRWRSGFARKRLTQRAFTRLTGEGPRNPDFSADAGPLQFGFATETAFAADDARRRSGIDNWLVTVSTPGPPPAELTVTSGSPLPVGTVQRPFAVPLSATGGTPPFTWSVVSGALPPGLTLDPSTGSIEGISTSPGRFSFTALVEDTEGAFAAKEFLIQIEKDANLGPRMGVQPGRLSVAYAQGSEPMQQKLFILNQGAGSLGFRVDLATRSGGSWLEVLAPEGVATAVEPGTLEVSANPASLPPGTYFGEALISSTTSNESVSVPVTMAVSRRQQLLRLSQHGLTFNAIVGGVLPVQNFQVINNGAGVMAWDIKLKSLSGGDWLAATPRVGASESSSPSTVEVQVRTGGLGVGVYYALLEVSAPDAASSPQAIPVVLNILPAWWRLGPVLDSRSLIFSAVQGSPDPPRQVVRILNPSGREMPFAVQVVALSGDEWLASGPAEGTVLPGKVADVPVEVSLGGLEPGVYRGLLRILFEDGTHRTADVRFVVRPESEQVLKPAAQNACNPTFLVPLLRIAGSSAPIQAGLPTKLEVYVVDDCANRMTQGSVVVGFGNIASPSVVLQHSGDGVWEGTWNVPDVNQRSTVNITITATDSGGITAAETDTVLLERSSVLAPRVLAGAVVHGASFQPDPLAPGTLISIFGQGLSSEPESGGGQLAAGLPLPTELAGTQITLGGRSLPILFSRTDQVNAVVPFELADHLNESLPLLIQRTDTSSVAIPQPVLLSAATPALFTQNASGSGPGSIQNVKFQLVTPAQPVKAGDVVIIYGTGLGAVSPVVASGAVAPALPPASTAEEVAMTIGGRPAQVLFAGLTPGFVSLYQINAVVPLGVATGEVEVVVSVAGQSSPVVTLAVD